VAIASATQRGLAEAGVRVVAVEVHVPVPVPAASDALLDPLGVGVGDAGQLGDAELEAEPRDELEWREAEEWVGEREL